MDATRSVSTASFSITITAAGGNPTWDTEPTFAASYTTSDSINITALASSSPVANGIDYSASDLPTGVDIDISTGDITGTPTIPGSYSVSVTATDSVDATRSVSTASFSITITAAGSDPTWDTTPSDQTFTQNQSSSVTTFTATADPYTNTIDYSASGTAMSAGLSIDSTSGELTGYFTSLGTYTATITATDNDNGNSISESISITVYDATGRDYQGYNSAGYNENGFNRAGNWDATYDDIDDVSQA